MTKSDLINIKNEKDFINYMKDYGNHVRICFGEYYGVQNVNIDFNIFKIIQFKNKHQSNVYNGTEINEKEVNVKECLKLLKIVRSKMLRKEKLERLLKLCTLEN